MHTDAAVQMLTDEPQESEITLHAISGWVTLNTIHVEATIGMHKVITLIDIGSTHYFIGERVAALLWLPVQPTKSFKVKVANGLQLHCQG